MSPGRRRLPALLLAAYGGWWACLAVAPRDRGDWWLENLLVFAAVPALAWAWHRVRLSDAACLGLFAFACLHAVGAHYTYSCVPYAEWAREWAGPAVADALAGGRNHFDRLVHLAYGALVTPTFVALMDACSPQRGAWRWLLPWTFMLAQSSLYEWLEWGAATVVGGDLGQAYLGTQGDVWDAHKDTALAGLGALLAVAAVRLRGDAGAVRMP